MPSRPMPSDPVDRMVRSRNEELERLRAVERFGSRPGGGEPADVNYLLSYTWQSARFLVTGYGHRFFAERSGAIQWCRVERSAGDGISTALCDVEINDVPIFITNPIPTLPAMTQLGDIYVPDTAQFVTGDSLRVNVLETGGGTGPLRVTIRFMQVG